MNTQLEVLQQLFSIVLQFDEELRVETASGVALSHMPWLKEKPLLTDVFDIKRPKGIEGVQDALEHVDQLYLMRARDNSFAVRGQIIPFNQDGEQVLFFCGAPWMLWINQELPDLQLGIGDFSPQDPQLDQLFYMTTEKAMVSDLELLNKQLHDAKGDLESAQQSRDAFFAQMSHEMRTPLNGVVSALALLEHQQLPPQAQELLALIQSSSKNLMQVINYVLDVSKIEAADGNLDKEPFRLDSLIDSVLDIVGAQALEKGLAVHLRMQPGLPHNFLGDSALLRQTLLNLVTNAIKFTDEGEVTVRVFEVEGRPGWIGIEVADTGVGVPESLRERIFEPFFSLNPKGKNAQGQGTGLGLDIVRRNIKAMNGELGLITLPGEGSTFTLALPMESTEAATDDRLPISSTEDTPRALQGLVLLVDDNETNLMLGSMLLEGLGLDVQAVNSGEAAVEAAKLHEFSAVLMDISMPGIDGFEATRQIRGLAGREQLPILALTAYASSREQENARKAGMNDYLTKPVSQQRLAQALEKWSVKESTLTEVGDLDLQGAVLNEQVLESLAREIGPANLLKVLETFSLEAQKNWARLVKAPNPTELAREAHSMVSTCKSFGLDSVAGAMTEIQQRARQGHSASPKFLNDLDDRLKESLNTLASWRPDGKNS